jgi:hypothetical protein
MIATMKNVSAHESIRNLLASQTLDRRPARAAALLPRLKPETRDHSSGSPRSVQ